MRGSKGVYRFAKGRFNSWFTFIGESSNAYIGRLYMKGAVLGRVSLDSDEFVINMYAKFPKGGEVFEYFMGVFHRFASYSDQLVVFLCAYLSLEFGSFFLASVIDRL